MCGLKKRHCTTRHEHGYSLMEVMVAIFVLAIVMALVFAGLRQVISQQERVNAVAEQHHDLTIAMQILDQDLAFLQARWYVQEKQLTAPLMMANNAQQITFIRLGEDYGLQANSPVKVRYLLHEGSWWRQQSDRLSGGFNKQTRLLANVDSWQWQFRDREGIWHQQWPPQGEELALPMATKVVFDYVPYGLVSRHIIGYRELKR